MARMKSVLGVCVEKRRFVGYRYTTAASSKATTDGGGGGTKPMKNKSRSKLGPYVKW